MPRTTSVQLNDHFADFVERETASGRYASAEAVVEAGLALLEDQEQDDELSRLDFGPGWTRETLEEAIRQGEESGSAGPLDFDKLFAEVMAELVEAKQGTR